MKTIKECRLYTFIDSAYLNSRDPARVASELCDGGSDIIQLRAKDWDKEKISQTAVKILKVLETYDVPLVINDHPEIAREIGASFCHLGQEDFFDAGHTHIQQLQDPAAPICWGLSTHSPKQASRAVDASPDYIAIGPVYATPTKPSAKPVSLDYVRWARENVSIPWFAIGGVNLQTIRDVISAGATRICVVSAILEAPNIAETCKKFRKFLD